MADPGYWVGVLNRESNGQVLITNGALLITNEEGEGRSTYVMFIEAHTQIEYDFWYHSTHLVGTATGIQRKATGTR